MGENGPIHIDATDEELLAACRAGCEEALRYLVQRHEGPLERETELRIDTLKRQLAEQRESMETLFRQPSLDLDAVNRIRHRIGELQDQLLGAHIDAQVKLRRILDEEQFTRLQVLLLAEERRRNRPGVGPPPWVGGPPALDAIPPWAGAQPAGRPGPPGWRDRLDSGLETLKRLLRLD